MHFYVVPVPSHSVRPAPVGSGILCPKFPNLYHLMWSRWVKHKGEPLVEHMDGAMFRPNDIAADVAALPFAEVLVFVCETWWVQAVDENGFPLSASDIEGWGPGPACQRRCTRLLHLLYTALKCKGVQFFF